MEGDFTRDVGPRADAPGANGRTAGALWLVGLGLAALVVLLALLDQLGFPQSTSMAVAALTPVVLVVMAALFSAARAGPAFDGSERRTATSMGALACAGAMVSVPSLAGYSGQLFQHGYDATWAGLGMALGFVLAAVLFAPMLCASGAPTLPEFLRRRYGRMVGFLAALGIGAIMFVLLAASLAGLTRVGVLGLGMTSDAALVGAALLVLAAVLSGGLRSVTSAQAVAALVLLIGVVVLAGAMSWFGFRTPLAAIAYGDAVAEIGRLEISLIGQKLADGASLKRHAAPYLHTDATSFLGSLAGAALGVAVFPILLRRAPASASPQEARGSLALGLMWLVPVLVLLPAVAAFAKLDLLTLIGKAVPVSALPEWVWEFGRSGAIKICGIAAANVEAATQACSVAPGFKGAVRLQDVGLDPDAVWLAAPRLAGSPAYLSGLAVAVLAAAGLAVASGATLTAAESVARGLWPATGSRAAATRLSAVSLVVAAAFLARAVSEELVLLSGWVLPLSASLLFAPMLFAIWWPRANGWGALAGMIVGAGMTFYYLAATRYAAPAFFEQWQNLSNAGPPAVRKFTQLRAAWDAAAGSEKSEAYAALSIHARSVANWWGLKPSAAALLGVPAGLAVAVLVTLMTPRPGPAAAELVARLRGSGARLAQPKGSITPSTGA